MRRALSAPNGADAAQGRDSGLSGLRGWNPPAVAGPEQPGSSRARSRRRTRAVRPSPVFLAFLAVAAGGGYLAWSADLNSTTARFGVFVMVLAGWVVSLSLHEFAHAYAAHRAGDTEAEAAGYLTLNPFRYTHPVLSLLLPLLAVLQGGIGLPGGAVYLGRHRFRSRPWRSLVAAAGPATNVLIAASALAVIRLRHDSYAHPVFWSGLAFFAFLQISAAVLNLLPIPGLDGWAIIEPYVGPDTALAAEKFKPYGMLVVFLAIGWLRPVDQLFVRVVGRLFTASGLPDLLWQLGYALFRFWQRL